MGEASDLQFSGKVMTFCEDHLVAESQFVLLLEINLQQEVFFLKG